MRVAFAVSLVALLLSVTSATTSAGAANWAWTKSAAEYYVGGNIGLTTACAPIGTPYRQGGLAYYYKFYCVVGFADGSQYGISIRPTGKTTYQKLSVTLIHGPSATPPPAPVPAPVPTPVPAPVPAPVPVPPPVGGGGGSSRLAGCYFHGKYLAGRVKIVSYLADFKVQAVSYLPDLRVQRVDYLPTSCGRWQFVDYLPDFTIQFVDYLPDFSIQFVTYLPGLP